MSDLKIVARAELRDENLQKGIQNLERSAERAEKEFKQLDAVLANMDRSTDQAQAAAQRLERRHESAAKRATELRAALASLPPDAVASANSLQRTSAAAGNFLSGISPIQATAAGVGLAIAGMGKDAIVAGAQLEQSIANIKSIKDIDVSQVSKQLNDMSTRIPQTALQLSEGLYNLYSSIDATAQEVIDLLEKTARGAVAARTDTTTFATAVVGAMNAYKLTIESTDHVSDLFFNTVKDGVVNGQELASSLGLVTQQGKGAGLTLEELFAGIVAVTREGGNASQNINNLSNLLAKLPTPDAQKGLNDLGVTTVDDTGKFRAFGEVITDLKAKLDGMSESARAQELTKIFPDLQARTALTTLISQIDQYNKSLDTNITKTGSATEAYATQADTVSTKWTLAMNKMGSAGAESFETVKPVLEGLLDGFTFFLDKTGRGAEIWGATIHDAFSGAEQDANNLRGATNNLSTSTSNTQSAVAKNTFSMASSYEAFAARSIIAIDAVKRAQAGLGGASSGTWGSGGSSSGSFDAPGPVYQFGPKGPPYKPTASDASLEAAERVRQFQEQQRRAAEAAARANQSAANSAAKKMDDAADAQRQIDQQLQLAKAKDRVAQAEQRLIDVQNQHKQVVAELRREEEQSNENYRERLAGMASTAAQSQTAYEQFAKQAEAETRKLDARLRELNQTLKQTQQAAKEALQTYVTEAQHAQEALEALQREAAAQGRIFDQQAHDITQRLQPLEDELAGQQEAVNRANEALDKAREKAQEIQEKWDQTIEQARQHVEDVAKAWDTQLIPAQERAKAATEALKEAQKALNAVEKEQDLADRADKYAQQQQTLENLTVRIAQATGAERAQLLAEQAKLKAQMDRDKRLDSAKGRVADAQREQQAAQDALTNQEKLKQEAIKLAESEIDKLQQQRDEALKTAEAQIKIAEQHVKATEAIVKSTQERIKAIERERQELERTRAEYDYQQRQKEQAAQDDVDRSQKQLADERQKWSEREQIAQAEIDKVQERRDKYVWEAGEQERLLREKADRDRQAYETEKQYHEAYIQQIDDRIQKAEKEGQTAEAAARQIVDAARAVETELGKAYDTLNKVDDAIDRGAKLTPDMTKALDEAKKVIQDFNTNGLQPVADQLNRSIPTSLAGRWATAWSEEGEDGFKKQHNTALHEMGNAVTRWSQTEVEKVGAVDKAYQDLITTMSKVPGAPTSTPTKGADWFGGTRASGGPVYSGMGYFVGEHGPEWFSPSQSGTIYPYGEVPYSGGSGSGGSATIINLNFAGQPIVSKADISYGVAKAWDERMREYYRQTGRN